jgi:DNA polymerase-3 subunit gamma/tau
MNFNQKYRPKYFSDVIGNKMPIKILKSIIKSGEIPTGVLIYGPPGTAKTTLAHLFVKGVLCENFVEDVCGKCESCLSLEDNFSGTVWGGYAKHDCSMIDGNALEQIIKFFSYAPQTRIGRQIHIFDEFHRTREPLQDKLLTPLEFKKHLLLIFCLIDLKKITDAFRRRVTVLRTSSSEIDELIPWLEKVCNAEEIRVKDPRALRRVAIESGRAPGECLSVLETIYHLKEPMTVDLVRDVAQDRRGNDGNEPGYTIEPS